MKIIKFFITLAFLSVTCLYAHHASASCTTPDIPNQATMSSISVSSTLPVGQVIPGSDHLFSVSGSCSSGHDNNVIIACYYGTGSQIPDFPGVYDTGVPGIGITLINQQGQRITGTGAGCDTRNTPLGYVSTDGSDSFNFTTTIALVKTSTNIGSGELLQSQTRFGVGVYGKEGLGNPNNLSYAGNINFKAVTCSTDPKSLYINLGTPSADEFTGQGTTLNGTEFSVHITCNDPVEIGAKLSSGNGYAIPELGVINLTQETGVASGVGVQFLHDDTPMLPNTYLSVGQVFNAGGSAYPNFKVRYYQTSNTITPGVANAVATLTISYR